MSAASAEAVDAPKLGECCAILKLVLSRTSGYREGLILESALNVKTGDFRDMLLVRFRKAKKGEPMEYKNAIFAPVKFCPFCGAVTAVVEETP